MNQTVRFLSFLCFFLVLPLLGMATEKKAEERPKPFLAIEDGEVTVKEQVAKIAKLAQAGDSAATVFFKETKANLGLDEKQISDLISDKEKKDLKNLSVVSCIKKCGRDLETAGLKDGKPDYWRDVHEGEAVVSIKIGEDWKPWFLLRCGNPVRTKGKGGDEMAPKIKAIKDTPLSPPTGMRYLPPSQPSKVMPGDESACCPIPVNNTSVIHQFQFGNNSNGLTTNQINYGGIFYPAKNRRK